MSGDLLATPRVRRCTLIQDAGRRSVACACASVVFCCCLCKSLRNKSVVHSGRGRRVVEVCIMMDGFHSLPLFYHLLVLGMAYASSFSPLFRWTLAFGFDPSLVFPRDWILGGKRGKWSDYGISIVRTRAHWYGLVATRLYS